MTQSIEKLLSSEVLSEEAKSAITEAWDAKLKSIREEVTAELREEFADRYDNDKSQIVEAMDAMLQDAINKELEEFQSDKKKLREDRIAYKKAIREHSERLEEFITAGLEKEIAELKEDRTQTGKNFEKLEEFVMHKLTEEINEFHTDKQALNEQRVKLAREGKKLIAETKASFIKKAATKVESLLESTLNKEITALKEDIQTAKENNFGRKLYETFATEFMTSVLNEGTQVAKLNRKLNETKAKIQEKERLLAEKDTMLKESERKTRVLKDMGTRKQKLNEMLGPLGKEQRQVMESLLESVKTDRLEQAYEKFLPSVLNETKTSNTGQKAKLTEGKSTIRTGDRVQRSQSETEGSAEIIRIKKLAGLT